MTTTFSPSRIRALALSIAILSMTIGTCAAATERVIYNFSKTASGGGVHLVYHDGKFYGAAGTGGSSTCSGDCGSIFELAPKVGGGWNYRLLYAFSSFANGYGPEGTVVFDASGNLYAAIYGGTSNGYGGVIKLTPTATGPWTETTIYSFIAGSGDGWRPNSGLTQDAAGNLYGVTINGGTNQGSGTVYKLSPNSNGTWSESLLYSFYPRPDGQYPSGEVTFDAAGNLYGTTVYGGSSDLGTVYEISPGSGGAWTETKLYSFDGTYGETPEGAVSLDADDNVYGDTYAGGYYGQGAVYELVAGSTWTPSLLHSFEGFSDGAYPVSGYLTGGVPGTYYGTTFVGGVHNGGIVFQMKLQTNGKWAEEIVYSFETTDDAYSPVSGVTIGPSNALFGSTGYGGTNNTGAIYEITP
jgi:uncharacterized repeat protein (TIGR03803 family)